MRITLCAASLVFFVACATNESERDPRDPTFVKKEGVAAGVHEGHHLREGFTALWWSPKGDYFVAGLHREATGCSADSTCAEPPQTGIYFGSLSDPIKRKVHWFAGAAPAGEDMVGVRVFKNNKDQNRIYFLSQLQNAGFYFPAFYYFNADTWLTTSIYSRLNCEQIEDVEILTSGLNIRCRVPAFGEDSSEAHDYVDKKVAQKAKKKEIKEESAEAAEIVDLAMDVDPTLTVLNKYADEQSRDWLSGVLRSCVEIRGHPRLCYPSRDP